MNNNYTHQYQYSSSSSVGGLHSSHSSPLSTSSSLLVSSPQSSSSTISQHYSSKGFDYDDDFQYVPDLILQRQYVQQPHPQQYYGNHHHYNPYYTPSAISAHNTGESNHNNSVTSSPSSAMNSAPAPAAGAVNGSFKFNPYKSLMFSPKTSPRKLDLAANNYQHASKLSGKVEIIDPSTGMSVLSASAK